MDNNNVTYEHIPQEKFEFAQLNANIHDKKLQTKSRGYLQDAFIRFKKNKSSVIAAWIIGFLFLYAIVVPLISPYSVVEDADPIYKSYPPYVEFIADLKLPFDILDGGYVLGSQNDRQVRALELRGQETGMDVIIRTLSQETIIERDRGKDIEVTYTQLRINKYYLAGMKSKTITLEEYKSIMEFQNETGIQVIYPYVFVQDVYPEKYQNSTELRDMPQDYNIWYQVDDLKGTVKTEMVRDEDGNIVRDENGKAVKEEVIVPAYATTEKYPNSDAAIPYDSLRIEGDDGTEVIIEYLDVVSIYPKNTPVEMPNTVILVFSSRTSLAGNPAPSIWPVRMPTVLPRDRKTTLPRL